MAWLTLFLFFFLFLLLPPSLACVPWWSRPVLAFSSSSILKPMLAARVLQSPYTSLQLFSAVPTSLPLLRTRSSITLNVLVIQKVLRHLQTYSTVSGFWALTYALLLPGMSFHVLFCLGNKFPFAFQISAQAFSLLMKFPGLSGACLVPLAHQDRVHPSLSWIIAGTSACFNSWITLTWG